MTIEQLILLLHILGAGVLIGVVFFSLMLTIKKPVTPEKLKMVSYIMKFGLYGSAWQLLTGLGLMYYNWADIKSLWIFWLKLGLYVLLGPISTQVIKVKVNKALAENDQAVADSLSVYTWMMVLIVVAIVTIGFLLVENY